MASEKLSTEGLVQAAVQKELQPEVEDLDLEGHDSDDELKAPEEREDQEEENLQGVQCGVAVDLLRGSAPPWVKQEPADNLTEHWEAQWQEFLKATPSLRSRLEDSPTPEYPSWNKTNAFLASFEGASFKDFLITERRDLPLFSQKVDGPHEVCSRLRTLCQQWLKPKTPMEEQVLELVILEQFLTILPPDMQSWIREQHPETCLQAASLAEDFLLRWQEVKGRELEVRVLCPNERDPGGFLVRSKARLSSMKGRDGHTSGVSSQNTTPFYFNRSE